MLSHFRARHWAKAMGVLFPGPQDKCQEIRGGLDVGKKIRIMRYMDEHPMFSHQVVAKQFRRSVWEVKNVVKYRARLTKRLEGVPKSHHSRIRRIGRVRSPVFPMSEGELYLWFAHQRFVLGNPIDGEAVRRRMRLIVTKLQEGSPEDRARYTFKGGWLAGFKRRHRISNQLRTDKKSHSFKEREQDVRSFHRGIFLLQNVIMPLRDLNWGHWVPSQVYHMDQIPLPFCLSNKRSLNPIGKYCWIRDVGKGGLDKRQATIMLTLRAEGDQDVKCVLIVAGAGLEVPVEELEYYKSLKHVVVYFQKKAWCDGVYAMVGAACVEKQDQSESHASIR